MPQPETTAAEPVDASRNEVIGLAELHEGIASRAKYASMHKFHKHTADVLRALADQRDYPDAN